MGGHGGHGTPGRPHCADARRGGWCPAASYAALAGAPRVGAHRLTPQLHAAHVEPLAVDVLGGLQRASLLEGIQRALVLLQVVAGQAAGGRGGSRVKAGTMWTGGSAAAARQARLHRPSAEPTRRVCRAQRARAEHDESHIIFGRPMHAEQHKSAPTFEGT